MHVQAIQEKLGVEVFQALFDQCSNWGRWGADDERGTLNLITPEHRVRAAGLVKAFLRDWHAGPGALPVALPALVSARDGQPRAVRP